MSNISEKIIKLFSWETFITDKFELWLLIGIIVSIFVPIRYVFLGPEAYILGEYSDFTSISLYLSQLFIISYVLWVISINRLFTPKIFLIKAILFLGILLIIYLSFLDSHYITISVLFYIKFIISLFLVIALISSNIWLKYKDYIIYSLIGMAALNAIIGIFQFIFQKSLGLNLFGESALSILTLGVAKVVAHETTFIRIYGFFPHPNILSGVLVIVSLLNLYLLNKKTQIVSRGILISSYCLIVFALCLTFSRGGILAYIVSTLVFCILLLIQNGVRHVVKKFYIVLLTIITAVIIFQPWYQSRATISDQAVDLRQTLNKAGIEIIKENWLFGTGPGTNVLHMKQKLGDQMPIWDIQPIHNYFLLIVSELGLIGIIILLFLIYLTIKLIQKVYYDIQNREVSTWRITLLSVTIAIFVLMQFDHYFYTNWSAQIILCMIIAWVYIETNREVSARDVSRETQF